jgi:sulfide:quinone oxidoreductase
VPPPTSTTPTLDSPDGPRPRSSFRIAVLGGGEAGLALLDELNRTGLASETALIEPSLYHHDQPAWLQVGTEGLDKKETRSEAKDRVPSDTTWIQEEATAVAPEDRVVTVESGDPIQYDYLVVALGTGVHWDRIRRLKEHLGTHGICSVYGYEQSEATWEMIRSFGGGRALFTAPSTPHKGGIAPLTVLQRAEQVWRESGIFETTELFFVTAAVPAFAGEAYADVIEREAQEENVHVYTGHDLIEVRPEKHEAVFVVEKGASQSKAVLPYDLLHVVPPMRPPVLLEESGLALASGPMRGYLDVDPKSLRHNRFDSIFGIGDAIGVEGVKTGTRARQQATEIADVLRTLLRGDE